MNVSNYAEKKKSGAVEVFKLRGGYALSQRVWDTETGKEKEPLIIAIRIPKLLEAKKEFQDQIDNIDLLISDLEALKK